jgi:hypothetical protein
VVAEYYDDVDGTRRVIYEVESHPLLRVLADFLSKANLNLADMGMTPRQVEEEQQFRGVLDATSKAQETLEGFATAQAKSLEALRDMMKRSQARREQDPVLLEYSQQNGGE